MDLSDFQSPLFVLTLGLALYGILMTCEILSLQATVFSAAVALLITQVALLVICAARGQTCFGFLAFILALEAGVTVICGGLSFSPDTLAYFIAPIIFTYGSTQTIWVLSSYHECYPLSWTVTSQVAGIVLYGLSEIPSLYPLKICSSVGFIISSITSLVTLVILL